MVRDPYLSLPSDCFIFDRYNDKQDKNPLAPYLVHFRSHPFLHVFTYIYQIAMNDQVIYLHLLNWNCENDWSYLEQKDETKSIYDAEPYQCGNRPINNGNETMACRPLYTAYYCKDKFVPN